MSSGVSPLSSPRLPSPPPIAEDQSNPKSPALQALQEHGNVIPGGPDGNASRRIRVGTKAEDMAEGPPLIDLHDIDSAFQLTEHLKALFYSQTHPHGADTIKPISAVLAKQLVTPPANTSKEIWLYELARFLIQKTNSIIIALFADDPACSPQTCPEMRASEWQYLCAVHDPPKSCSAIDYCCHTLDWAANTLTSSKMFPSRLSLGSSTSGSNDKVLNQQMKELTNVFRRVYRIYAHAWFQHRELYWRVEGKTGLYIFFKTVCDEYGLIQPENYTIPPEAEGNEPEIVSKELESLPPPSFAPTVLQQHKDGADEDVSKVDTTKRHPRHTYNTSSSVNSIVIQEEEEESLAEKPALGRQTTIMHASQEEAGASDAAEKVEEKKEEEKETTTDQETVIEHDGDSTIITLEEVKDSPVSNEAPAWDSSVEEDKPAEALAAADETTK